MNLTINGEEHFNIPDGISVADLLKRLSLPPKKIAIERNLEIISKSTFEVTKLINGDKLEIIHFLGGG